MNQVLVQEMKDELRAMYSLGVDEISVEDARAAEMLEETLVEIPCACFPWFCHEKGCE